MFLVDEAPEPLAPAPRDRERDGIGALPAAPGLLHQPAHLDLVLEAAGREDLHETVDLVARARLEGLVAVLPELPGRARVAEDVGAVQLPHLVEDSHVV